MAKGKRFLYGKSVPQSSLNKARDLLAKIAEAEMTAAEDAAALFTEVNSMAYRWVQNEQRKEMNPDCSRFFCAAATALTKYLHKHPAETWRLADVLVQHKRQNENYAARVPVERAKKAISIVATGGEQSCRTLYVTIAAGIICSFYMPTVVHGNYAVTGCRCGQFAESDMMASMGYQLGRAARDAALLESSGFCYLHLQRYHPILKAFAAERGVLGFRDMMKLTVAVADFYACAYQFVGTWNPDHMEHLASAFANQPHVRASIVASSDTYDEFSEAAYLTSHAKVRKTWAAWESAATRDWQRFVSFTGVAEEIRFLRGVFTTPKPDDCPKTELIIRNAAGALGMVDISTQSHGADFQGHVTSRHRRILEDWKGICEKAASLFAAWPQSQGE